MTLSKFDDIAVVDKLPTLTMPPVTRHTLAIYCGASGDHTRPTSIPISPGPRASATSSPTAC